MSAKIHAIKCWQKEFAALVSGEKRHELRKNDRAYCVGDVLVVQEFDPDLKEYTGAHQTLTVTHITMGGSFGLPEDLCIMSVRRFPQEGSL
jgi:hypothetical protein